MTAHTALCFSYIITNALAQIMANQEVITSLLRQHISAGNEIAYERIGIDIADKIEYATKEYKETLFDMYLGNAKER